MSNRNNIKKTTVPAPVDMATKLNTKSRLHSISLNKYTRIDTKTLLNQTGKWYNNGKDNSFFYTVEDAYLGSPTNQAIIDNFTNYILGDGLMAKNGFDVNSIFSEEDQRLAVCDFKMQGACALQIVKTKGKTISKAYYLPIKTLAINRMQDISEEPDGYWYSFNWQMRNLYPPIFYPAFGMGDGYETEILYIKRHSPQPLFALPDWMSGMQYAQTEQEMSNYYIKHITNNFSAGKLININQGVPDSDTAQDEAERAIKTNLSGTDAAGQIIISFNNNKENATTIDNIEVTDAYQQFQFLSGECRTMIMMAHKINDPSLFGLPLPSGFSSQAEQTIQSLKVLYRSQIKPARNILIQGFEELFKAIDPTTELFFQDFEELRVPPSLPPASSSPLGQESTTNLE
jgi:hypothetical protein